MKNKVNIGQIMERIKVVNRMTRKDAIDLLNMVKFESGVYYFGTWYQGIDGDMKKAIVMSIKALKQMEKIEHIINSPVYIQEDVLRYKLICEVIKESGV